MKITALTKQTHRISPKLMTGTFYAKKKYKFFLLFLLKKEEQIKLTIYLLPL